MSDLPPEPAASEAPPAVAPHFGDTEGNRNVTTAIYALQAASFVFGITGVIAVIVNYVKLDDVRGTWLESHFNWQIRTFWWSVLWAVIGFVLLLFVIGAAVLIADSIWVIYRIVKGWLRLNERRPMDA